MDKYFPIEDQIAMLASALRGEVITPTSALYDERRALAHANFDDCPAAVIRVANAADVAAILNFARATGLPFAVRSGGHSVVGHSVAKDGIVIDVRGLNRLDIDAAGGTAWCGTGLTAGEVTRAVEQHGLIVGFGDSASVGIGGLTLGGGIGYMVRKHGLTIDSLLAAEVVTAEGDILIADATHHAELFWALRGGGGNFGVVTRLKFKLNPLLSFVGGPLVLPATAEVIAGFAAAAAAAPDELSTIAMVMPIPPVPFVPAEMHGKLAVIGMMAYSGDADRADAVLAPFRALATPIADLVRPAPYSSMYAMDPPPDVHPMVSMRSRFVDSFGIKEARSLLDSLEHCDAPMKMAQLRVLGGAFSRVPEEATAFAHRKSPIMVAFLALHFGPKEACPGYDLWAAEAMAALGMGNGRAYVNFVADEGEKGLLAAYPPATLDRLRRVKRQYDPENLFRLNQNVPPAA